MKELPNEEKHCDCVSFNIDQVNSTVKHKPYDETELVEDDSSEEMVRL